MMLDEQITPLNCEVTMVKVLSQQLCRTGICRMDMYVAITLPCLDDNPLQATVHEVCMLPSLIPHSLSTLFSHTHAHTHTRHAKQVFLK